MKQLLAFFLLLFAAEAYAGEEVSEAAKAIDVVRKWDNRDTGKDLSSNEDVKKAYLGG